MRPEAAVLYCTYGQRVPASCVLYVPEAQGSLLLERQARYVRRTRTSPGRAVRTEAPQAPRIEHPCYLVITPTGGCGLGEDQRHRAADPAHPRGRRGAVLRAGHHLHQGDNPNLNPTPTRTRTRTPALTPTPTPTPTPTLTFTKAAAEEMQQRLTKALGRAADKVLYLLWLHLACSHLVWQHLAWPALLTMATLSMGRTLHMAAAPHTTTHYH